MTTVAIYTDGSANVNTKHGGWGAVVIIDNCEYRLHGKSDNTTNNKMELKAVVESVKMFKDSYNNFKIYADSTYVINCATNKFKRSKNLEEWKEYNETVKDVNIVFEHVKAHNGDYYNEIADKLSRNYLNEVFRT